jgi:hypothetical protein
MLRELQIESDCKVLLFLCASLGAAGRDLRCCVNCKWRVIAKYCCFSALFLVPLVVTCV